MSEEENFEHPALKRFNEPLEYVKHVAKKAIKWAAIGALVGGVLMAAVPGLFGGLIAGVASFFGGSGVATWAAGGIVKAFATGALTVGLMAGATGGLFGLADAGDAVQERKEQFIAAAERAQVRSLKMQAIRQRQEAAAMQMGEQGAGMGHGLQGVGLGAGQQQGL